MSLRIPELILLILMTSVIASGQKTDSLKSKSLSEHSSRSDAMTLIIYTRTISDANGNVRFDQNIVPNFKVNKWLRVELGIRQGERLNNIGAYNHYKIEIQTKSFFKTVRLIARMSDNVVRYTSPNYSRTNYLLIAESKYPLSDKFDAIVNVGYSFAIEKDNVLQGEPIVSGSNDDHGIYKLGVKYKLNDKGALEALIGTYDVFNPYLLTQPFTQVSFDYELFKGGALYSYFRYQYNKSFDTPFNDFLGLGLKLSFSKHPKSI